MKKKTVLNIVQKALERDDIVDIKEAKGLFILTRKDRLLCFCSIDLKKYTGWYRGDYKEEDFFFVLRREDGAIRLCSSSDVSNRTDFFFGRYKKNKDRTVSYWEIDPEKKFTP